MVMVLRGAWLFVGGADWTPMHHFCACWQFSLDIKNLTATLRLLDLAFNVKSAMNKQIFEDLSHKINGLLKNTPAADLEKNLRALLSSTFAKLDLVTREEFDVQREVLMRSREKIAQLEARLAALERDQKVS